MEWRWVVPGSEGSIRIERPHKYQERFEHNTPNTTPGTFDHPVEGRDRQLRLDTSTGNPSARHRRARRAVRLPLE